MRDCPWSLVRDGKKHIVSLVGGGGKTTLMYELAAYFAGQGRRVICMTTTHIWRPALLAGTVDVYAQSAGEVEALWRKGHYAVIGCYQEDCGKLIMPEAELLDWAMAACELLLVEADGAKRLPCKIPAEHEPALLPQSDSVIAVCGLDALQRSMEEVCFRWQLGCVLFGSSFNGRMDERRLAMLLTSELGARKCVDRRAYYIALNKCDLVDSEQAARLRELLVARGIAYENIWLRGKKNR